MPVLLFPHEAYFLVKAFVPAKDPQTGRINYYEVGLKWVKSDLRDPVQREHAHNHYLTLCPWISQADRDKVASEWADIRHAREAKEAEERKEAEEVKKAAETKQAEEKGKTEEAKKAAQKVSEERKADRKRKMAAMLEESEGVAKNIAKVEKKLKSAAKEKKLKAAAKGKKWMDVVMDA